MREWIDFALHLSESVRQLSPDLQAWTRRWVESSYQIEDQVAMFEAVRKEASRYLNVSYPALYRGLSMTDEMLEQIRDEGSITIPAHRLQSWTKSRMIADDYALPGHGGDNGVLVRKTRAQIHPVADITVMARLLPKGFLTRDQVTDSMREKEVVIETDGTLTVSEKDIMKIV